MLSSSRCILRPVSYSDCFTLRSAFNTPGFDQGMMMKGPLSIVEALRILSTFKKAQKAGEMYVFTIANTKNRCMGQIWVKKRSQWVLGYWLHPKFQGNGYMREVMPYVLSFLYTKGIRPESYVYDWNEKSASVLRDHGFQAREKDEQGLRRYTL